MDARALVLGGGGIAGIAWGCGYLLGLEEAGAPVADASLVVGTSAGSVLGAWVTGSRPLERRYRFVEDADSPVRRALTGLFGAAAGHRARNEEALELLMSPGAHGTDVVQRLGELALETPTMPEPLFVGFVTAVVGRRGWDSGALRVTASDVTSGERVVFSAGGPAGIGRACAASSSVPGVFPPVVVRGRPLVDGGCGSGTNADLAAGAARALVVSLLPRDGDVDGATLAELEALERGGTRTRFVRPGPEAVAATGGDALDPHATPAAARAGREQGRADAEHIGAFWRGETER